MENIFFLVLVALVGLLRFIMQIAEKKRNAEAEKRSGTPATNAPPSPAPSQTEEERIRKFFEALGVPTSAAPPPKVQPRQISPKTPRAKRPILPVDPFPQPRTLLPPIVPAPPLVPSFPTVEPGEPALAIPRPAPAREPAAPPAQAERTVARFEVADLSERAVFGATADTTSSTASAIATPQQLVARLRTAEGLRDAVVLREIFGPPRSMQALAHSLAD
jgi:hypothetical protein